jgi:hypothetical protein
MHTNFVAQCFQFFPNAHFIKSLDFEIGVAVHTMHTNHEWCILLFH